MASTSKRKRLTKAERQQRDRQALTLFLAGVSYDEIANALGWANRSGAFKAVQRELETAASTSSSTDTMRQVEALRLDQLHFALWPLARKGHQGAVDRVLRIMERRSKLFGLDKPIEQKVVIEQQVKEELDAALNLLEETLDADTYALILQILATAADRS